MAEIYDVLINYDITTKNDSGVYTAIKDCMLAKGYADKFTHPESKNIINLPNTTLWKKDTNVQSAIQDLEGCVTAYNTKHRTSHEIERCIALKFTDYWAYYGAPHSSNSKAPIKN